MKIFFNVLVFSLFAFNCFGMSAGDFSGYWERKGVILHMVPVDGTVTVYDVSTAENFSAPDFLGVAIPQGEGLPFLFVANGRLPPETPIEQVEMSVSVEAKKIITKIHVGGAVVTQDFEPLTQAQAAAKSQAFSDVFASVDAPAGESGWGVTYHRDANKEATEIEVDTFCDLSTAASGGRCYADYGTPGTIFGCYFWDHEITDEFGNTVECMDCVGRCGRFWWQSSNCSLAYTYLNWSDVWYPTCKCR